jgi:hypothetical protein
MERGRIHPRRIFEDTSLLRFKSTNFELLSSLLDRTAERDKQALFEFVASRIENPKSFQHKHKDPKDAGKWSLCSSELPLVAEFLVRNGQKHQLFQALGKSALSPGITLLLLQLEELIAFNFTAFTDDEYSLLEEAIGRLSNSVTVFTREYYRSKGTGPTIERNTRYHLVHELPELCASTLEECRKARFLYIKASLLPGLNLEVNQDKGTVITFLERLGFTRELVESLNESERLYRTATSPFDFKSSMGHLRSFLEALYLEACILLHKSIGGTLPSRWGEAHEYLKNGGILTAKEQQVIIHLYTLMSDTTVHPLVADREYARLMRNVCIEFGLLLLTKVDKSGIK